MRKSQMQDLRKVAGDLSGLYGMQDFTFNEGKAKGMRAIRMDNGRGLSATLLADRCLDIPYYSYKGVNLGAVMKTGLSGPSFFKEDGKHGFLKQFNGGLLTTCGILNAGAANVFEGRALGLHGQMHNIPGTSVNKAEVAIDGGGSGGGTPSLPGDAIALEASAEMREACVFEEYVVLRRAVRLETERNVLHIADDLANCGFAPAPLSILYHVNFGYPFIDAGTRLYFSTPSVEPYDETALRALGRYALIEGAEVGRPEECFIHTGGSGEQFGLVHNERLGLAAALFFDIDALPFFCQWKCMMAGDYALGLEPSASGFWGASQAKEKGRLKYLGPGETQGYRLRVELYDSALDDGAKAIERLKRRCKEG